MNSILLALAISLAPGPRAPARWAPKVMVTLPELVVYGARVKRGPCPDGNCGCGLWPSPSMYWADFLEYPARDSGYYSWITVK